MERGAKIGVLALQGAFDAHAPMLRRIDRQPVEVRRAEDLAGCRGLILPGGESGVQLRLLERDRPLREALRELVGTGAPVLATCAGLILAARQVREPQQSSIRFPGPSTGERNVSGFHSDARRKYRSMVDEQTDGERARSAARATGEVVNRAPGFGWLDVAVRRNGWGRQVHSTEAVADDGKTPLILIRAPRIEEVGPRASVELTYRGEPVLVRQGAVFGATFHPELTGAPTLHASVFV